MPATSVQARSQHAAVWTGREMIVWAGYNNDHEVEGLSDGSAFDPATGVWRAIAPSPLSGRSWPAAIWTGTHALLWGGIGWEWADTDGAIYDPAADSWTKLPRRPFDRSDPFECGPGWVAWTWTGKELFTWGGEEGTDDDCRATSRGAAFDPVSEKWRVIAASPIGGRSRPSAVWTGREVVVWGGWANGKYPNDGAAYDPRSDSWRPIPPAPVVGRAGAAAVWTGVEVLVWGSANEKFDGVGNGPTDGAAYNPLTNRWRRLSTAPLEPRLGWRAVWANGRLVVWGGVTWRSLPPDRVDGRALEPVYYGDGAAYDPKTDTWEKLPAAPLAPRAEHTMVWTGSEILVWGGENRSAQSYEGSLRDGAAYRPADGG
jgi:Kelch motif protein